MSECEKSWPTSAETSKIAWPINVMAGCEWNILDATGCRIAMCGYDGGDPSRSDGGQDCFGSGREIGLALVGMLRNLKIAVETLTEENARLTAALRAERAKLEKFAAALKSLKKYEPLVYDERDEHGVLSYAEMDETPSGEWVRFSDIEGAMK